MSSKRRRFSGELKAKVALEALRGDRTLQEIASQHQVHPNQVGAWKRQAMEGPRTAGQPAAPLPAERHAGAITGPRPNTAEILLFTSLSVPAASWRQWARDAARIGATLVMRGVAEDGLRATATEIRPRLGGHDAGVAIDPRLFRLFGIERVPAVAVVPGGVPPCESRGCADDPAPAHDLVTGNIGLAVALEAIAEEGAVAGETARQALAILRNEK